MLFPIARVCHDPLIQDSRLRDRHGGSTFRNPRRDKLVSANVRLRIAQYAVEIVVGKLAGGRAARADRRATGAEVKVDTRHSLRLNQI